MAKYQWRATAGPKPAVAAQVFGETIERLAHGRSIQLVTAKEVLAEAKRPRSPIHKAWNWDLEESAEAHWLDHARNLCGQLEIVHVQLKHGRTVSSKALFNVIIQNKRGYATQHHIRSSEDLTRQVLVQARDDLQRYLHRFERILGFGKYVARLQTMIDQMSAEIDQLLRDAA
jgi:hypothetical protein